MTEHDTYHILLIEDNPGDARLISEYLKDSLLTAEPAITAERNLERGLQQLKQEAYDIILLDLSLPDSFGMETFEEINQEASPIPIIVLTGLEDEKLGVEAVQRGAQDFLIKKDLTGSLLSRSILYSIQRNQLSLKLERSQERLLEAQRLAHLGSYEFDLETGELVWSAETFRIMGMNPAGREPTFSQFKEMFHPDDVSLMEDTIRKVRVEGKRQAAEHRIITDAGDLKFLHSIFKPVKNEDGEVVKIFGTIHDITQRKRAENRLKENERRYRMLFQAATDEILVYQLDDDGLPMPFLEVNNVACNILGYEREELEKLTVYDIVDYRKEEVDKQIDKLISKSDVVRETRHVAKDGTIIPLEVSAQAFNYNGKTTIISVGRDIRERRKLEQEILNISEQERRRIGRDLHDGLGQMLTGIGLISRNLANQLANQNETVAEQVQEISDMIKEADEHARGLAHGLVPVNVEANGLDAALRQLASKSRKMYDVNCEYTNGQTSLLHDNTVAVHMYRIAQEAINNAIKHGKAKNITIKMKNRENSILLQVEDDGKGFPETTEVTDGMGVRIMHYRAQMIGGNLEINSTKGQGTEVICTLPIRDTE